MGQIETCPTTMVKTAISASREETYSTVYWSKFDPHGIMTCVLATRSFRHSGAISEADLLSMDASIPAASMHLAILELPYSGASDPHKTTTTTDHL